MGKTDSRFSAGILALLVLLGSTSLRAEVLDRLGTSPVGGAFPNHVGLDIGRTKGGLVSPQDLLSTPGIRHVVVSFFRSSCAPCLQEIGLLSQSRERLRSRGVEVLLVGVLEEPRSLRRLLTNRGWDFPVLADRFDAAYARRLGILTARDEMRLPAVAMISWDARAQGMVLDAAWQGSEADLVGKVLEKAR